MTKQEKIKEAYGDYWGECNPFIDTDGWFDKNAFYNNSLSIRYSNMNELFIHKGDFMRPKKLEGIDDNNGWTKIESEKNLPKERGCFWTFIEGKEVIMNTFNTFSDMEFTFDNGKVTHYQSLTKPSEPLY